jgi:hypothetical protein
MQKIQKMQNTQKIQKIQKIQNIQKTNAKKSSQFNDKIASSEEFSLNSLLAVDNSKKKKSKNCSFDSQNKKSKSDTFTKRDSSDLNLLR